MGIDYNRTAIIAAVLEKKAGVNLSSHDIFVNVAGGIRLSEPAVDLALAASLASSHTDIPIPPGVVFFGEIGLSGEVTAVSQSAMRITEANGSDSFADCAGRPSANRPPAMAVVGIKNVGELIDLLVRSEPEAGRYNPVACPGLFVVLPPVLHRPANRTSISNGFSCRSRLS
jgi:DNA repair protein RadA/Sms